MRLGPPVADSAGVAAVAGLPCGRPPPEPLHASWTGAWLRSKDRRSGRLGIGKFNAGQKLNAAFVLGGVIVMFANRIHHVAQRVLAGRVAHRRDVRA